MRAEINELQMAQVPPMIFDSVEITQIIARHMGVDDLFDLPYEMEILEGDKYYDVCDILLKLDPSINRDEIRDYLDSYIEKCSKYRDPRPRKKH